MKSTLGLRRPASEPDARPLDRVGTLDDDRRFRTGLAVLLEGSIRGLVGEYHGKRLAGHRPCPRCGCVGMKA